MLIHCHFPGGAPFPENSPTAMMRASAGDTTSVSPVGRRAIGIAEKEQEERGKDEKRHGPGTAEPESDDDREEQGAADEGQTSPVDQHLLMILGA